MLRIRFLPKGLPRDGSKTKKSGALAPQTERLATLQARKAGRPERTRGFGGGAPGRNGAGNTTI